MHTDQETISKSLSNFKIVAPIGEIKPFENNPRNNANAVEAVASSIRAFGWNAAIVVDRDRVIVCGHTRYKAACLIGLDAVPIVVAEHLTPEQVKAYRIADNRTGDLATWDIGKLQIEMDELSQLGFDMEAFGFSELELADILGDEDPVKEGETDPDAAPELPETPDSREGAIYRLGNHTLMCGDARNAIDVKRLAGDVLASLWLTDPPYNVAYEGQNGMTIKNDSMGDAKFFEFLRESFSAASTHMKAGASFYIFHADSEGYNFRGACKAVDLRIRQCLVWSKNGFVLGRQDYQWAHEPILYGWKSGASHKWNSDRKQRTLIEIDKNPFVQRPDGRWQFRAGGKTFTVAEDAVCIEEPTTTILFPKPKSSDVHPTMKPVEMLIYLIKNSSVRGGVVLDTFAGSGSTLIACEQTSRSCLAMELDPKYCDVIWKRWAEFAHGEGCDWQRLTPERIEKNGRS